MKKNIRWISALLAILTLALLLSGCTTNYEKMLLGTWEFQREYRYSGLTDCSIIFHEDNTITYNGVTQQGGNYYVKDDDTLKLLIGSGSFENLEYPYDAQKGREKDSGYWCVINNSRIFIDGVMYKKVSSAH